MGKCADCGYLSVRNKDDYSLGEPSINFREKGQVATTWDDKGRNPHSLHEPIPLCFARQPYLASATEKIKDKKNPFKEVRDVIQENNDCKEFTHWQQGFTPKEHREMIDRERMTKWQTEREEADRKWRSKQQWKLVVVAGIFTLLGVLITWLLTRGG